MKKGIIKLITTILIIIALLVIIKTAINLQFFIIETGSMQPVLNVGDLCIVKKQDEYYKYDIITYYQENFGYITHRIIDITDEGKIITKGDYNNIQDDVELSVDEITGKVIFKSKILGLIFTEYRIELILILIILISINFYLIFIGGSKKNGTKKEKNISYTNKLNIT